MWCELGFRAVVVWVVAHLMGAGRPGFRLAGGWDQAGFPGVSPGVLNRGVVDDAFPIRFWVQRAEARLEQAAHRGCVGWLDPGGEQRDVRELRHCRHGGDDRSTVAAPPQSGIHDVADAAGRDGDGTDDAAPALIQRARNRYRWDTRPTTKRLKLPASCRAL